MDREIWTALRTSVKRVCKRFTFFGRKPTFSYQQILLMYLWSVWQGGCLNWACDKIHYGDLFRPRKLPSISQFRRRVSAVSKDIDARNGHITGGFGKGYKLHAVISEDRRIIIWSVMPLNVAEQSVAMEFADYFCFTALGLVLADSNYDSAPLHKSLALSDHRLLTPLKAQQRVKDGVHHPVTLRQMGSQRREALEVWNEHEDLANYVLKSRNNVEGVFSVLSMALNAGSPPPWVRRLARVRRWVGAMIIMHNVRVAVQEKLAKIGLEQPHMN